MSTEATSAAATAFRYTAELANQINPDVAGGVFLDALMSFTGGARRSATQSTISGVVGSSVLTVAFGSTPSPRSAAASRAERSRTVFQS